MDNEGWLYFDEEILEESLRSVSGVDGITVTKEISFIVTFPESKRQYKVDEDGRIEGADSEIKIADETPDDIKQKDSTTYVIQSIEDLVILSKNVESGTDTYAGKTFELETNLDFNNAKSYIDATSTTFGDLNNNGTVEELLTELTTGKGFVPIGTFNSPFEGNINGNGKEIKNLYINERGLYQVGFIGMGKNNTIQKLKLGNVNIKSKDITGGLIGNYTGTSLKVDNCFISGTITSSNSSYGTGGILGDSGYTTSAKIEITNCTNEAVITGGTSTGGLIGLAEKISDIEVINCKNKGVITSSNGMTGGLIGNIATVTNNIIIDNCTNSAKIVSQEGNYIGGLIGDGLGDSSSSNVKITMKKCVNTGDIECNGTHIAGIIGRIDNVQNTEINSCYNTGNIEDTSDYGSYSSSTILL